MNKIYKVILIIIMLNFPKLLLSADMVGYLMNQAEQEYNDKNYQKAYTSLQNIAPTGNPKAMLYSGTFMALGAAWGWRYPSTPEEYDRRKAAGERIGLFK